MYQDVLNLVKYQIPVFPVHSRTKDGTCSCRKANCSAPAKHPRTSKGLKDATIDPDMLHLWWEVMWPDANIGMPTGKVSGVIVLDADDVSTLEDKSLPYTIKVKTSRGWHLWFRCPKEGMRSMKLEPGLDLRADGAYVLGPGSTHISGAKYEVEDATAPIAEAPEWLLEATEMTESELSPQLDHSVPIKNGERNNTLFKEAASLRGRGYDEAVIYAAVSAMNQERCNPPISERELKILVESACRYDPNDEKPKSPLSPNLLEEDEVVVKVKEPRKVLRKPDRNPLLDELTGEKLVVDWILPGFVPRGTLIALAGMPGVGKSYLSYYMSFALATGTSFLGMQPEKPFKTLYFDQENSRHDRVEYERRCYIGQDKPDLDLLGENFWCASFELGSKDWFQVAQAHIEMHKPDLIIFDTATPCFRVENENDNSEAAIIIGKLRQLMTLTKPNPGVIVLKHGKIVTDSVERKMTLRGAKAWEGQVDSIVYQTLCAGRPRNDGLRNTQLSPSKTRAFGLDKDLKIYPEWIDDKAGVRLSLTD